MCCLHMSRSDHSERAAPLQHAWLSLSSWPPVREPPQDMQRESRAKSETHSCQMSPWKSNTLVISILVKYFYYFYNTRKVKISFWCIPELREAE